jgi:hypothetical protein
MSVLSTLLLIAASLAQRAASYNVIVSPDSVPEGMQDRAVPYPLTGMSNDNPPQCCLCSKPAVVLDTEYNEVYCERHARSYEVYDGPHILIE